MNMSRSDGIWEKGYLEPKTELVVASQPVGDIMILAT